jgi:hypothetical protein
MYNIVEREWLKHVRQFRARIKEYSSTKMLDYASFNVSSSTIHVQTVLTNQGNSR